MNPKIMKLFANTFNERRATPNRIANTIGRDIQNRTLPYGTLLPSLSALASYLKVPKEIVAEAYRVLEYNKKLIKTRANRTVAVNAFKPAVTSDSADPKTRPVLFNTTMIPPFLPEHKTLHKKYCEQIEFYYTQRSRQVIYNYHDLLKHEVTGKLNKAIAGDYTIENVMVLPDYLQTLHLIATKLVTSHQIIVVPTCMSSSARRAIEASARKIISITLDAEGAWLREFASLCANNKIALFYLSSRFSYPFHQQMSTEIVDELIKLQLEYKFTIVEDDLHAAYLEKDSNLLMDKVIDEKTAHMYIRRLTYLNGAWDEVIVVAGTYSKVRKLRTVSHNCGRQIPDPVAYALMRILKDGQLIKCEKRMNGALKTARNATKMILKRSASIALTTYIGTGGCFIYLDPLEGEFPDTLYQELLHESIYVIDPAEFSTTFKHRKGVCIAIAAYVRNQPQLVDDLNRLIKTLESKLI